MIGLFLYDWTCDEQLPLGLDVLVHEKRQAKNKYCVYRDANTAETMCQYDQNINYKRVGMSVFGEADIKL